jgi:hypothetical protein
LNHIIYLGYVINTSNRSPNEGETGCEITKNSPISHHCHIGLSFILTFLKRGVFTLVKNFRTTFSVLLRLHRPLMSSFLIFSQKQSLPVCKKLLATHLSRAIWGYSRGAGRVMAWARQFFSVKMFGSLQ